MDQRVRFGVLSLLLLFVYSRAGVAGSENAAESLEFFEKQVRPLLVDRCLECHGAGGKSKGGLNLSAREAILKGGDSGPAAVPGKPEESLIVEVIRYIDEPRMPPKGKLKDQEIEVFKKWVAMGLPWPEEKTTPIKNALAHAKDKPQEPTQFWSFQPLRKPVPPKVENTSWVRGDIDRFVLAAIESKGLKPAKAADKRTLIRRATFDLTGLPPTPEEVQAFLADESSDAFAKVVDRLLASPHYGERWGRHWLDIVRYADSFDSRILGNEDADIAFAWRYRDWVVNAFNRDLPYDKFILHQLAGDVLPPQNPDGFNVDETVATGMLAIGNWGGGDADKEKLLTDIADDQVDLVGRTFLGLTVACARCHDHKFDPISTKDYYGLAGIFFSTHILPNVGPKTNGPPMLRIPLVSKSEMDRRGQYTAKIATLEGQLNQRLAQEKETFARSMLTQTARYVLAARDFQRGLSDSGSGALHEFALARGLHEFALRNWIEQLGLTNEYPLMRTPVRDVLGKAGVQGWRGSAECPSLTVNQNEQPVTILTFTLPPRSVCVHPGPSSGVAITWKSPINGKIQIQGSLADADAAGGDGVSWRLTHRSTVGTQMLAQGAFVNGGTQQISGDALAALDVKSGDRLELLVLPKGEYTCDTTVVSLTLTAREGGSRWDLTNDLLKEPLKGNPHADGSGRSDAWRFEDHNQTGRVLELAAGAGPALEGWKRALSASPVDSKAIESAAAAIQASFQRTDKSSPFWVEGEPDEVVFGDDARQHLTSMRRELAALKANPPAPITYANGALEGGVPDSPQAGCHDVRVHIRGSYSRLGDVVPRHFPTVLGGEPKANIPSGSGRLELARWLAKPDHVLTSRVMANRIWQHHMGAGIVRTPSNFGSLGERPTHPELLDFLASLFVESGWSIKKMHRALMLSAVYQQASEPEEESAKADPDNRLFTRMNRKRLEAEAIRDNLLAVSGQLDPTLGGPSLRELNNRRRTLYLTIVRSDRSSFGPLFDAADSTALVDNRTVSTVAPQALFLINNPYVLDQAQALARRVLKLADGDQERIRRAYLLLFSREPNDEERKVGEAFLQSRHSDEDAWMAYCQILVCANEFVYID